MVEIVDLDVGMVFVGGGGGDYVLFQNLLLKYVNCYGLIVGVMGIGKMVMLQMLVEFFFKVGVLVFMFDVKGDLVGIVKVGDFDGLLKELFEKCVVQIGILLDYQVFFVIFWDIWGECGYFVWIILVEMGLLLLLWLMNLIDVQEGVLNIVFCVVDEEGLVLLDMKDL